MLSEETDIDKVKCWRQEAGGLNGVVRGMGNSEVWEADAIAC